MFTSVFRGEPLFIESRRRYRKMIFSHWGSIGYASRGLGLRGLGCGSAGRIGRHPLPMPPPLRDCNQYEVSIHGPGAVDR